VVKYANGRQSGDASQDRLLAGLGNVRCPPRLGRRPRRCTSCHAALSRLWVNRGLILCLPCIHAHGLWRDYTRGVGRCWR
jgi:hypothetical protein